MNSVMDTASGTITHGQMLQAIDANLSEAESAKAQAMASQLSKGNLQDIYGFGREIGATISNHTDALLTQVKASDLDSIGTKLGQIVSAAQTLNLHALSNSRSRIPLIGPFIDKIRLKKSDFVRKFQDVRTQVDTLVNEVDMMQNGLGERTASLDETYTAVTQEYRQLGVHIAAGEMALNQLKERAAQPPSDSAGSLVVQEQQALAASLSALDKRIGDLRMLQHAALQQLPMIRMVQTNNFMLIEKFHTIKQLTLPAWKRQFLLSVSLNEQKNAVELAGNIDDATNEFLRENARLLRENTISTARANQRMVIDIETLQEVHDGLVTTVKEVILINCEGAQQRAGIRSQLTTLRDSMTRELGSSR